MRRPSGNAGPGRGGHEPSDRPGGRSGSDANHLGRAGPAWLGPRDAQRLLDGQAPVGHAAVAALLAAAAGPAEPPELAGERAALAEFRAVRGNAESSGVGAGGRRHRWGSVTARAFLIKAAVGVSVTLAGGAALAGSSVLLDPAPQKSPVAGPPSQTAEGWTAGATPPEPSASARASPTSAGSSAPAPAPASTDRLIGACHAWQAVQRNPNASALTDQQAGVIAAAVRGQSTASFCAALLAEDGAPPARGQRGRPAAGATGQPGNSGGNSRGNSGGRPTGEAAEPDSDEAEADTDRGGPPDRDDAAE